MSVIKIFFKIVKRLFVAGRLFFIKVWNTILYFYYNKNSLVINAYIDQRGLGIRHNNFGDDLNFYLIKELTGRQIFNYNSFFHSRMTNYICIGSIVEDMTNEESVIWGGGVMYHNYEDFVVPRKIVATRGPLTRQYIMKYCNENIPQVYGDPALLMPVVYKPNLDKIYDYGIIPHISEFNNPMVKEFVKSTPKTVVIDFKNYTSWKDVIDLICQCRIIVSSSLHGLILADAYGIPNVWMRFNKKTGGGEFKYRDYYGGVLKEFDIYEVDTQIEEKTIHEYCDKYKGITFDYQKLLNVCPFL